jgi:hypothetical protein
VFSGVVTMVDFCCDECGEQLKDEDYFGEREYIGEFWGSPAYDWVCNGYICSKCGHKEVF